MSTLQQIHDAGLAVKQYTFEGRPMEWLYRGKVLVSFVPDDKIEWTDRFGGYLPLCPIDTVKMYEKPR